MSGSGTSQRLVKARIAGFAVARWEPVQVCSLRRTMVSMAQATPETRLRGEIALFWNPTARNLAKRWTPSPLEKQWNKACQAVGVRAPFQQGTRHTTYTALAQVLPERVLRDFSRHRDAKSLDHYTKAKATPAAIVKALRPPRR